MDQAIVVEVNNFLRAIMLGVIFGFAYDILRILRRIVKRGRIAISIEDVFYWFVVSIIMFIFLYQINGGTVRAYVIVAVAIGMILYEISIGRFVVKYVSKILRVIINKIGKILRKVLNIIKFALKKCLKPFKIVVVDQKERINKRKENRERKSKEHSERKAKEYSKHKARENSKRKSKEHKQKRKENREHKSKENSEQKEV